jgi:hypothetical protein
MHTETERCNSSLTPISRAAFAPIVAALVACGTPTEKRSPDTTHLAGATTRAPADWRRGATCYEVFVRSFYDSDGDGVGDLRGLTQKLDYINDGNPATDRDLGARCMWLMPVVESPSYHGYDATDYYRVDPDYGTNADFKAFAAAAHVRGIAVLVDMVLNHVSNQHPFFRDASSGPGSPHRSWFRWSPSLPAEKGRGARTCGTLVGAGRVLLRCLLGGDAGPELRHAGCARRGEEDRDVLAGRDGCGGFRLDAVPYLVEEGSSQIGTAGTHAFLREYAAHVRAVAPNAFTVGEVWDGIDRMLPYYPDQLESYFAFDLADSLVGAVRGGSAALAAGARAALSARGAEWPLVDVSPQPRPDAHPDGLGGKSVANLAGGGGAREARRHDAADASGPAVHLLRRGDRHDGRQARRAAPDTNAVGRKPECGVHTRHALGITSAGLGDDERRGDRKGTRPHCLPLHRALIRLRTSNAALAGGGFAPLSDSDRERQRTCAAMAIARFW